jgi:Holliday junction resolvase
MTGGRGARQKGNRLERALVRALQDNGFAAERVPLSGSAGGSYTGDLTIPLLGRDLRVEAKARGNGFQQLYRWLGGADLLIVRANRSTLLLLFRLLSQSKSREPRNDPKQFRLKPGSGRTLRQSMNNEVLTCVMIIKTRKICRRPLTMTASCLSPRRQTASLSVRC